MVKNFPNLVRTLNQQIQKLNKIQAQENLRKLQKGTL